MIDPWGRLVPGKRLDPGESGVIDALLPRPAAATLYGRWGDLPFWLAMLASLAVLLPWRRLRRSGDAPANVGAPDSASHAP
jgi:apolipoprotein N-acyltransferase